MRGVLGAGSGGLRGRSHVCWAQSNVTGPRERAGAVALMARTAHGAAQAATSRRLRWNLCRSRRETVCENHPASDLI